MKHIKIVFALLVTFLSINCIWAQSSRPSIQGPNSGVFGETNRHLVISRSPFVVVQITGGVFEGTNQSEKTFGLENTSDLLIDVTWNDCSVLPSGGTQAKIIAYAVSNASGSNPVVSPTYNVSVSVLQDGAYCQGKRQNLQFITSFLRGTGRFTCEAIEQAVSFQDPCDVCNIEAPSECDPCTVAQQEIDDLVVNDSLSLLEKCNRIIAIINANPSCDLKFTLPSASNCP